MKLLLLLLLVTIPNAYAMEVTCGQGTTQVGFKCVADIFKCGEGTYQIGKQCKAYIVYCGGGTYLEDKTCMKYKDNPISNAPHQNGSKLFQDMDNLRIYTANPHELIRVWDHGTKLKIELKTVDYTLFVVYNNTLLDHVDTGFCYMECPKKPQTFIFNVEFGKD